MRGGEPRGAEGRGGEKRNLHCVKCIVSRCWARARRRQQHPRVAVGRDVTEEHAVPSRSQAAVALLLSLGGAA